MPTESKPSIDVKHTTAAAYDDLKDDLRKMKRERDALLQDVERLKTKLQEASSKARDDQKTIEKLTTDVENAREQERIDKWARADAEEELKRKTAAMGMRTREMEQQIQTLRKEDENNKRRIARLESKVARDKATPAKEPEVIDLRDDEESGPRSPVKQPPREVSLHETPSTTIGSTFHRMETPPERTPMREPSSAPSTRRDRTSETPTPTLKIYFKTRSTTIGSTFHRMDTPPEQTPMREPSSVLSTRRDRNSESETPSTTLKRRRTEDASAGEKSDGESSSLQPRRSKRARATGTISAAIAGPSRTASLSSTPSRTASLLPSTKQESKPRFTQPNGNQLKLSDDFLDKHLNPNSAYLIHPVPSDPVVYVHRIDDLQVHFGGPQQSLISYMPAFMSPPQHPSRKSCEKLTGAFPQPEFNPHLPSEPGAPGLIFASRADIAERGVRFTVFCRKEKESREEHVVWRYMGEYLHERVGTVSGETWKAQSDKVQTTWAKHIMKIERGVYAEMREALRAEKAKKGVTLKPNHIIEALCSGKGVTIGIIQMTCVGYDHAYAERLRIAAMTPAPATASASGSRGSPKTRGSSVKGKGKGKGKQKQQQGPAGRPRRPGTRKSYNPDSDDPHSESEPQPESESEYEDGT